MIDFFPNMFLLSAIATVKDWADLLHSVAWPLVALVALFIFRKGISDSFRDILNRIPWERATSVKAPGLLDVQMKADKNLAKEAKILPGKPPKKTEVLELVS